MRQSTPIEEINAVLPELRDRLAGTGVHATSMTTTATIGSAPHFEPAEIAKACLELDNEPEGRVAAPAAPLNSAHTG
jgi:hypothetical protein